MKAGKRMDCDGVMNLLARWSDGELDAPRGESVRAHLIDCLACRGLYGEHRKLERWIVAEAAPAVPAGFGARVARLASEHAARTGGRPLDVSRLVDATPFNTGRAGDSASTATERASDRPGTLVPLGPRATSSAAAAVVPRGGEGSILAFVLACTAAAAAVLLVLSLALGAQVRPSGEELRADPLPEVLRALEDLKRTDAVTTGSPARR